MKYFHYCELISFITGLCLYKKSWPIYFKLLVAFLGLTFAVELTAWLLWDRYQYNNNWIYNIYLPIQCLVFLFFFWSDVFNQKIKKVITVLFWLMVAATVIAYFFHRNFFMLNSYAADSYLVLLIIVCGCFFIDAMINKNDIGLVRQSGFWLASGLLFFSVVLVVRFALWNFIVANVPEHKAILHYTNNIANTILYTGFIGTFICKHIAIK